MKVSWALIFCASWWMLWRLDFFFTLKPSVSSDQIYDSEKKDQTEDTNKEEETFKPEGDAEKESKNEEEETSSDEENQTKRMAQKVMTPILLLILMNKMKNILKFSKLLDDTPRDFTSYQIGLPKKNCPVSPRQSFCHGT